MISFLDHNCAELSASTFFSHTQRAQNGKFIQMQKETAWSGSQLLRSRDKIEFYCFPKSQGPESSQCYHEKEKWLQWKRNWKSQAEQQRGSVRLLLLQQFYNGFNLVTINFRKLFTCVSFNSLLHISIDCNVIISHCCVAASVLQMLSVLTWLTLERSTNREDFWSLTA